MDRENKDIKFLENALEVKISTLKSKSKKLKIRAYL